MNSSSSCGGEPSSAGGFSLSDTARTLCPDKVSSDIFHKSDDRLKSFTRLSAGQASVTVEPLSADARPINQDPKQNSTCEEEDRSAADRITKQQRQNVQCSLPVDDLCDPEDTTSSCTVPATLQHTHTHAARSGILLTSTSNPSSEGERGGGGGGGGGD